MADKSTLLSQEQSTDETSVKYMLKLAWPMVVTTISFTIMQFVDRFMVSRLGTDALAAILPAGMVSFLPGSFAIGMIVSVATFVSQSFGKGAIRDCSSYCWQAIYLGLAYFLVVVAVMWPSASFIFKLMGQPAEIISMEIVYFRIMLYAQVISVFIWCSSQFFMGIHRPIITMYSALCGQLVNVAANYVLIFGKLGFPAMGIAGAGWGTFIGVVVGAGIRMIMFLNGDINSKFECRRTTKIDFEKMKDLLKVGLPAGFELMTNVAFWGVVLFGLVGKFGKEALAATSAVFSCTSVSVMPIVGISSALTAAVGKAIGGRKKNAAIKQTSVCLKIALTYMGLIGLCFFVFREPIMRFWAPDDKVVVEIGVNLLVCAAIYQVFYAARIIYSGSLRGAGDTVWLAGMSAAGAIVILGLGGFLISVFFPQLGALGPWLGATLSVIAVGLANHWRFKSNRWKKIDLFKRRAIGVAVDSEATVK